MASTYPADEIKAHAEATRQAVTTALKLLLEKKHLYQSVKVDFAAVTKGIKSKIPTSGHRMFDSLVRDGGSIDWSPLDVHIKARLGSPVVPNENEVVYWRMPDIRSYCRTCKNVEPFNGREVTPLAESNTAATQIFALTYVCQGCKGVPEVFLVRRQGSKVTLSGRSPMEAVQVPDAIPESIQKFYSDAVVAFQSGQVLAALFMLRVCCEQWARRFADEGDRADVAIEKYMASIPESLRDWIPSIRDVYGELSAAVHSVDESIQLYEKSATALCKHFDIRRAHDLPTGRQR